MANGQSYAERVACSESDRSSRTTAQSAKNGSFQESFSQRDRSGMSRSVSHDPIPRFSQTLLLLLLPLLLLVVVPVAVVMVCSITFLDVAVLAARRRPGWSVGGSLSMNQSFREHEHEVVILVPAFCRLGSRLVTRLEIFPPNMGYWSQQRLRVSFRAFGSR